MQQRSYFTSMTSSTTNSKYGLGTIALVRGEYDKAVNLFGNEASSNNALAHILKGDLNKAKECLTEWRCAHVVLLHTLKL